MGESENKKLVKIYLIRKKKLENYQAKVNK